MTDKDLEVVVFGATGVTGRRVAAYLAEQGAATGARWGAAARDAAKLAAVQGEDGVRGGETIVADLGDPDSLDRMAARAKVVLDLVGPYTLYARPVIEACVANGSHYLDLTGELPFVRRVIDDFDRVAADAGVKLVQVCGFEALPPDLGVLLAAETAEERFGEGLASADVEVSFTPPRGLPHSSDIVSGGTMQSMAEMLAAPDAARITDPASLVADSEAEIVRSRSPIALSPRRGLGGTVIAPMTPSGFINPAVIQRTAALRAAESGRDFQPFRYREGMVMGGPGVTLPFRYAAAGMLSGTQVLFGAGTRARPGIRRHAAGAMRKLFPSSGFGPQGDRVEGWRWGLGIDATTTGGKDVRVELEADGHPGYLSTARMLGEAGLVLAEGDLAPERFGCLTPAMALGTASVPRFERARMRFSVLA